jgi:3-hydroxyacyl-[acyl-carrier-protein] dehydratase
MPANRADVMNRQQIEALIPHRPPMLLVDEVLEKTDRRIVCRRRFVSDEFFFQGHYPDFPLVPGVILCEACMQAGAILLADYAADGIPVATRMNDVRFRKMVRPGDEVRMEVDLVERLANAFFMRGKVTRDGQTVMRFEFACTVAPPHGESETATD